MAEHKDLTGASLHEPKGVATADAGEVYVADGAGSGVWSTIDIPSGTFVVTLKNYTTNSTWTKPANCFVVKVTATGGPGLAYTVSQNDGGDAQFGSSPVYVLAGGGDGESISNGAGAAGVASSGTLNINGEAGSVKGVTGDPEFLRGARGKGPFGEDTLPAFTTSARGTGGSGACSIRWITASTLAASEDVIASDGGRVVIEEYIKVV